MQKGPAFFKGIHVGIALVCLTLFIGVGSYVYAMSPGATARVFLNKLEQKDVQGAYALTSVKWQEQTSLETFTKFLDLYSVPVDSTGFLGNTITQGEVVMYKGMYLNDKQQGVGFQVDLIQEQGSWKVLTFHIDLPQK